MKRILLVLIILNSTAYAQDERYSISAHFGHSLSGWLYSDTDLRSCFNAGIEVRRQLKQSGLYLQTGLRWNEYGFGDTIQSYIWNGEDYDVSQDEIKLTFFYFTVPLIATYKFNKAVPGLTISAGPQMSVFLFQKSNINGLVSFDSGYNRILNFSTYFSMGYEHNIGDRWILGGEAYSNFIIGADTYYNFGIGISGRYILK
ncbi:MAG: outer membrane beta-barrel protein [Crocinitomix sp.]|nr:outer membrane beta-barrel protein [Crocinitomix sp.]